MRQRSKSVDVTTLEEKGAAVFGASRAREYLQVTNKMRA